MLIALVAAACGGGAEQTAGDAGPAVVGNEIRIAGTDDFRFQPARVTVEAGSYEIVFENKGVNLHQLALSGQGEHEEPHHGDTHEVSSGKTKTIEVDLEAGTYEYACHVPGHYEAGMKGTLTVTE